MAILAEENLFILSMTLSNNKTYLVEVKKGVDAATMARLFCKQNSMEKDLVIRKELTELLAQYIE